MVTICTIYLVRIYWFLLINKGEIIYMEVFQHALNQQFLKLSIKQVTAMVHRRMSKNAELLTLISKYCCEPYLNKAQWVEKLAKWEKEKSDISIWMQAAKANIPSDLWEKIVSSQDDEQYLAPYDYTKHLN